MADQVVWTAPDGTTVDLTDWAAGYYQLEGATGLQSPSWQLTTSQLAGMDGVRVDAVRASGRELSLPMYIEAPTKLAFRQKVRAMVHTMRPKSGPGVLKVSTEWGETRTLTCYCTAGLEGDSSNSVTGATWWRFILKFMAADPWWYGAPVTTSFGLAVPSVFLSTTLPMPRALSSSSIQGQATLDLSASDDPTPGSWTITGPGVGLTMTRELLLSDGSVAPGSTKTLSSSVSIPDGGTVVVKTRRGEQSIRRGDGTNLGGSLAAGSTFWSLAEGVNRVTVLLGGAGANSSVQLVYSPKYGGI